MTLIFFLGFNDVDMNTSGSNSKTLIDVKSITTTTGTKSGLQSKVITMVCGLTSSDAFNATADKVKALAITQNGSELSRTHTVNTEEMTSNIVLTYGFNDFQLGEWFKDRLHLALGINTRTYTATEL